MAESKPKFVLVPSPIEDDEICAFCGEVGRITLGANDAQRARGWDDLQVCEPCLNTHGARTANDIWEVWEAVTQSQETMGQAFSKAGSEIKSNLDFKIEVRKLD